ncbi:MAG: DUF4175 family protein, partial [Tangfeifania sp.]
MTENFNILVNKLNAFRVKYYSFKLVKGLLLTFFLMLLVYTAFSLVEYFVYLSSEIRKGLFFGFLIFGGLLAVRFIFIPVLKLLRILKPMNIKKSSEIVQEHFSEIKDRLLNIIELSNISDANYSNEIVLASIDQKIEELSIFDFKEAVQFKNLRLVFYYFLFSLLVTFSVFVANKSIYTSATNRIVHYNQEFIKPAPFSFQLLTTDLKAQKGDPFTIKVETTGDQLPQMLYINIEGNNYLMKNTSAGQFEFEMASVINPVQFYFTDLKYKSGTHLLQLLPKPGINHFDVTVIPPKYTGLPNRSHENIGDLQVPNGTEIKWNFKGIDIDTLYFELEDSTTIGARETEEGFVIESDFYESSGYNVFIKNDVTEPELAFSYEIDVIPDLFPEIQIVRIQDSTKMTRYFFKGIIGDDYGFTGLNFHYNINNTDSAVSIPFVKNLTDQEFYFSFNFADVAPPSGTVSYYFSVTDNDVVNGYKTTTSDNFLMQIPDKEEIMANEKEQFQDLEEKLQYSQELAREIQNDLQNLRMKNMDSNISEWEKSQMVNDVLSKQNKLEQLYDQIKKDNKELNNYLDSFDQQNDEIREKQAQIEELLEDVFTDELKELLEEFNQLAEEFDSKKMNQLSEKMDLTYEDLQKQMDRNLEMLRKMKVEQKLQSAIDEINKMGDEEEKLADDVTENKNFEEAEEKVSEHKEQLENLEQEIQDALEMNQEIEKPMNFDDFQEEMDDIKNSMDRSREELQKKNKKKSGSSIKQTSEKMKNTAFAMQQMLNSNTMEQNMENIENLRQILGNLVYLSFEQEDILDGLTSINVNDPVLNKLNQEQLKIQNQSQIVKDSLYALAKRTPQINTMVNNELLNMELNLGKALEQMSEGQLPNVRASQQYVITSANNLALMLDEALQNLEEQMANAQPGDQNCEKPGQGKPGMNMLKQQSEDIKQQLQQMIEQMKSGEGKPGNQK